jgi:hypothetical protein
MIPDSPVPRCAGFAVQKGLSSVWRSLLMLPQTATKHLAKASDREKP